MNIRTHLHPDFWELQEYFGSEFDLRWCNAMDDKEVQEATRYASNDELLHYSPIFCYQSIALATQGIHRPYIAKLLALTADLNSPTVLDYGSGGGQVGLALHTLGYNVSFADIYSQSAMFLVWRLRRRCLNLPLYLLDFNPNIPHHNIAVCFDVIEHLSPDEQKKTLGRLGELADCVLVNLIRGDGSQLPGFHLAVDIDELTRHVSELYPCLPLDFYEGRQRLLIYGNKVSGE